MILIIDFRSVTETFLFYLSLRIPPGPLRNGGRPHNILGSMLGASGLYSAT
jgi:hypothetical protein